MSKEEERANSVECKYVETIDSSSKACWLVLVICSILLSYGHRILSPKIEQFLTLSAEMEDSDLSKFMSYLDNLKINANVSDDDVEHYHNEGYLLIRNFYNQAGIEAMRFIVDFVNDHPSELYKLTLSPERRFCGFFIHPFYLIPAFRRLLRKELESGMSSIASKLLLSNEWPVEVGSILHSTRPECFSKSEYLKVRGNTHSDQNQATFSIERKRTLGDNMLVT